MLDRLLELLRRNGFTDVCATLCYRPDAIQEHCGDGSSYGVHLRYRIETEPRGTAGAVRACSDFYGRDDFLVISGDAACSFDLLQLYRQHQSSGAAVTVALYPDAEPLQYGLVLQDREGYVRHFIEKPDWPHVVTDLVNTGIYIVSPRAMTYVPEDTPFDFANDLFPLLLAADEPILGVPMDGYWCDIGTPRAYYRCCLDVLDGRLSPTPQEAPESPDAPAQCTDPLRRSVPCRDRAHPDAHPVGGDDGGRRRLHQRPACARRQLGADRPAGCGNLRPAGGGKHSGRRRRDRAAARTDGAARAIKTQKPPHRWMRRF